MAKINKPIKTQKIENYEGGQAFELSPEMKLVQMTSTCLFKEPKFYGDVGDTEEEILRLTEIVAKKDPKFLLQLALYLRSEQNLRTIPMVLLAKASNIVECKPFIKEYTPKIIQRADEINEVIAAYISLFAPERTKENKKSHPLKLPNSLKKGIAKSFESFDEYQFGKYNRKTEVRFKDVIMLTHPKEPSDIIKKILDGNLEVPYTWETSLSTKGNKPEVWEQLIDSEKLGYFAVIRNLRNILTTDGKGVSDKHIDKVINYIKDPKKVQKSKLFPFRFFSAYKELYHPSRMIRFWEYNDESPVDNPRTSDVLDALEEAIEISYENIPHMPGTTLIACDVSGSMENPISKKSKLQRFDIGLLLGAATYKYTDKGIIGIFGDDWKQINLAKKSTGIIANTIKMHEREGEVGYSTNGYLVIQWAINNDLKVDRFLFFSDNQMWDSQSQRRDLITCGDMIEVNNVYKEYKKSINPKVKLYIFDLAGYGTMAFPPSDPSIVGIAGWSDKVLQFIKTHEEGIESQINYIKEKY